MKRFSSLDLRRNTARVRDAALRAPIAISHHGRDRLVILSIDEFERLKRRDKAVIAIKEMPAEFRFALQESQSDPEQAALDHLLDE